MKHYLTDTHAHIYAEEFDKDREDVVANAFRQGVKKILLPNIDSSTITAMLNLSQQYPDNIYPMMGLHPTSVKEDFENELQIVRKYLQEEKFYAIGEIGIDLYWDQTFVAEQKIAFETQIDLAIEHKLPIVIHARESFNEIFEIMDKKWSRDLKGVFHSFTGNQEQADKIINDYQFYIGINGILTFKNSNLSEVVKNIDLQHILLETDAPYLAPVPKRGKRNESSFVYHTALKMAEIHQIPLDELARITTENAENLFHFPIKLTEK